MSETEHELEEAEIAELDREGQAEDGDVVEDEPEAEVEAAPPTAGELSEKDFEKLDKALTAEDKRHQNALGKAYGESWPEHVRCAMCDGIGFMSPEAARALTTAQWEQLLQVAAMLVTEDYIEDSNYQMCENCAGKGQTRSGATNADHYLKLCDGCSGNGYVQRVPQAPAFTMPAPLTNGTESVAASNPSYGSPAPDDPWGRHAGHPHYGIDPNYVITS